MIIGTTSFGFRYQLLDAARPPSMRGLIGQAAALGLDALQICENARPLAVPAAEWRDLIRYAADSGVRVGFGCKTTRIAVFEDYLRLAELAPGRTLRLVFEEEQGAGPSRAAIDAFLAAAAPRLRDAGVRLAIENHFDVPSGTLAEAIVPYEKELMGFCVDTANSLRNFESPERVLELLGPRAFCYHVKDYSVRGHMLGFVVEGAPLGRGHLPAAAVLGRILQKHREPELYVENWVPESGDRDADIANDDAWLRQSLAFLRGALVEARRAVGA